MIASRPIRWHRPLLLGVTLLVIVPATHGDGPAKTAPVASEMTEALAHATSLYETVTASGVLTISYPASGTANPPQHISYARNGTMRLARIRELDAAGQPRDEGERVLGTDGRSYYELTCGPSGQYVVNLINSDGKSIKSDLEFYAERYVDPAIMLDPADITSMSGLRLEPAAISLEVNRSLRKFSYRGMSNKNTKVTFTGSITMAIPEGGELRAFESSFQPPGKPPVTMKGQFEFGAASSGEPVPPPTKSVVSNLTGGEVEQVATFVFDKFSFTAPAASQFQLAAFRLGDVAQPVGTANPNWLSYLAFALGALAIIMTVILRVAAHRRASATATR